MERHLPRTPCSRRAFYQLLTSRVPTPELPLPFPFPRHQRRRDASRVQHHTQARWNVMSAHPVVWQPARHGHAAIPRTPSMHLRSHSGRVRRTIFTAPAGRADSPLGQRASNQATVPSHILPRDRCTSSTRIIRTHLFYGPYPYLAEPHSDLQISFIRKLARGFHRPGHHALLQAPCAEPNAHPCIGG